MSGTFRIAGLLTGIVLALALVGPAVFAFGDPTNNSTDDSFNQANRTNGAGLTSGAQSQTLDNSLTQTSRNNATNFGNGNDAKAKNEVASGSITVFGPKLVLVKHGDQNANSSATGTNTGGAMTQNNTSVAGTNSGTRTATGGSADTFQVAKGGSNDATNQNYVGAKQNDATANSTVNRGGGGNGTSTGGNGGAGGAGASGTGGAQTGTATGGAGGGVGVGASTNTPNTNSCNVGAARNDHNGGSTGGLLGGGQNNSLANSSQNAPDCGSGSSSADASGKSSGGDATANKLARAGDGTGGDGGKGGRGGSAGNVDGGANGPTSSAAGNVNLALSSSDQHATTGSPTTGNLSAGNTGGAATVSGDQKANGGDIERNNLTQNTGHSTGPAWNAELTIVRMDMSSTATTGDAKNYGNADAKIPVINKQDSSNKSDVDITQKNNVKQDVEQRILPW